MASSGGGSRRPDSNRRDLSRLRQGQEASVGLQEALSGLGKFRRAQQALARLGRAPEWADEGFAWTGDAGEGRRRKMLVGARYGEG